MTAKKCYSDADWVVAECQRTVAGGASKHHWEGGKGCRSQVRLDHRDKHKYTGSALKTESKKALRVGAKGKETVARKMEAAAADHDQKE
jgi:hypothetical protein